MKKESLHDHRAYFVGACLVLGAIVARLGSTTALAAEDQKNDSGGFVEKMKQWEDEMSRKFHDTFKNLWADSKEKPLTTASADLREQKDNYIVRLNLPARDLEKVEVKLDGNTLHIVAPAEKQAARYEQTITLSGVASDAPLVIDRREKENLIVITVPKSSAVGKAGPPTALPDPFNMPMSDSQMAASGSGRVRQPCFCCNCSGDWAAWMYFRAVCGCTSAFIALTTMFCSF